MNSEGLFRIFTQKRVGSADNFWFLSHECGVATYNEPEFPLASFNELQLSETEEMITIMKAQTTFAKS